jgi:uncharacterized protein
VDCAPVTLTGRGRARDAPEKRTAGDNLDGYLFWTLSVIAAVLVGMSKGGVPVASMLSVPIMAQVMSPVVAAGILLPIYVASDIFGLYAYRRSFNRRVVVIVVAGATLGVAVGWATAAVVSVAIVTLVIGLIGAVFAVSILLRRRVQVAPRPARVAPGLFWGAVAGFTSFVSHSGAPPYQVYTLPLGMDKAMFAGTTTVAFAIINAIKLIPYYQLGQLNVGNLQIAAVLAVPAIIAVFAGVWLVRWLPERLFFQLITWTLLAISLRMIWTGVAGWMA